jgi:hypothetical protein
LLSSPAHEPILSFKRGREQHSQPKGIAIAAVLADTELALSDCAVNTAEAG